MFQGANFLLYACFSLILGIYKRLLIIASIQTKTPLKIENLKTSLYICKSETKKI